MKSHTKTEPFISQTFGSEEEALVLYRNYAKRRDFGIRKDRYDKRNNKIVRCDLSCHRGRKKPVKVIDASKDQRKRESSRCECNAHMHITLKRVFEIFPEEWLVSRFVKQHNHKLLLSHETRLLACNRVIKPEDEEKILLHKGARLSVRQIIRVKGLEKRVEHGDLPFIEKDICNLFMKTFVQALRKPPKTIMTDQDPWMSEAIASEMPTTKHSIVYGISHRSLVVGSQLYFAVSIRIGVMDVAIKEIELKRTHNNMTATVRPTSLKTRSLLEEQAFQVLTLFAFKKFQEEIEKASQYSLVYEDGKEFILKHYKSDGRMHTVFWDGSITLCNCKNFEFWGILCHHMLRVFIQKDCFRIPPCYLSLCWRSDMAESSGEVEEFVIEEVVEPNLVQTDENLRDGCHVLCPPKSKRKGRSRKIRLKGGKEQAKKQTESCLICKQYDHTKLTCPLKVTLDQGVFNAFKKRQKVSASDIGLNPIFCLKD
ncbi:hypothetical protein Cgig2_010783 [Carnegiea gigantea]|uniref:Protein FAR1-RELATED SEQUENCE n=1 Tax=Carnegiea gigantea TaxID=171969 RepID=A0A9Q1GLQ0_9CARY|nr:hypothetical protein Cgig2_010783 [Carnegiea gigantea]